MRFKKLLLAASAIVTTGGYATASYAQQTAVVGLEEITVTARKVEENIMQVPLAITAFSSKDLEQSDMKQMTDISQYTPSFHFINQTGGGSGRNDRGTNSLTFRGVFAPSNSGTAAGGLLFIDGAPVLNAYAPSLDGIERVEVLKGPQSAYFGRSTFAGAINFVTRDPSMTEYKGKVSAEVSTYNSTEDSVSFEGPLVHDKLGIRVSGRYYHRGGEYTNASNTNEKFGEQTTKSVSGQIVAAPSDNLKFKGSVGLYDDNDGPPMQMSIKNSDGIFNCNPGGRSTYYCGAIPNVSQVPKSLISGNYALEPYAYNALVNNTYGLPVIFNPNFLTHGGLHRSAVQMDGKIDYDMNGYTFESLTAYHHDKLENLIDLDFRDGTSYPNQYYTAFGGFTYTRWELAVQALSRDWSQEFRLTSPQTNRFRFTAGANYIYLYSPGGSVYGLGSLSTFHGVGGVGFDSSITRAVVKTPSVFGGAYYDIVDKLTLSFEARYQWDKILSAPLVGSNALPVTGTAAGPFVATYKSFSPRVSLDYKYAPDSTLYGLWSRGYRPGGFNAALFTSPPTVVAQFASFGALPAYQQEELSNFEIGDKSTFLDNRARIQLSLYYDKWTNAQVSNTIPFTNPDGSLNLSSAIVNSGRIDLKGIEWQGDLQATENLTLGTTLGLNDTTLKSFLSTDGTQVKGNANVAGNHEPIAPKWTWTASAEYKDHLSATFDWFARVEYNHVGGFYVDYSNVAWTHAQNLINLRAGVRNSTMTLEAFVTNLTQNSAPTGAFLGSDLFTGAGTNEIRYALPPKRQFGIRGTYNF